MFGYTIPIESMLSSTDAKIYRNYYCETCHQLRQGYGFLSTSIVNYEMTFANIFLNSLLDEGTFIETQSKGRICILRRTAGKTELMKQLTAYTILVANNGLVDDKIDEPSLKSNLGLLTLNPAITKARSDFPEYDRIIMEDYNILRDAEKKNCMDVVKMGQLSAQSMIDVFKMMLGDMFTGDLCQLFKNLGVWVYVMDAIEDLDEDAVNGTYNPFLTGRNDFTNMKEFIQRNIYELTDIVNDILGNIQTSYSTLRMSLKHNQTIIDNIIYYGIPASTQRILKGDKTMNPSLKNMISERLNRNAPQSMV